MAEHTHATPRRGLLAGLAATAVAAPTLAAPAHPDAALIAACDQFVATFASMAALDKLHTTAAQTAWNRLDRTLSATLDRACRMQATTQAGFAARARMFAAWMQPEAGAQDDPAGCHEDRMMAALVRDMAMGAAA